MFRQLENFKFVSITPPAAIVDNAAYTTAILDTQGFAEALVVVVTSAPRTSPWPPSRSRSPRPPT